MKFGMRTPSPRKSFAARTSVKRYVRHNLGFKAPRGMGWFTNPRKAAYNRVYNRTTFSARSGKAGEALIAMLVIWAIIGTFILAFYILRSVVKGIATFIENVRIGYQLGGSDVPVETREKARLMLVANEAPECPRCSRAMVHRIAKRGRNKGGEFWGCPGFPRCRGTRPWE